MNTTNLNSQPATFLSTWNTHDRAAVREMLARAALRPVYTHRDATSNSIELWPALGGIEKAAQDMARETTWLLCARNHTIEDAKRMARAVLHDTYSLAAALAVWTV